MADYDPNYEFSWLHCCYRYSFVVLILSIDEGVQKQAIGTPRGPIQGAPREVKRGKNVKIDQNLNIFFTIEVG